MAVVIDKNLCDGCGDCVEECAFEALEVKDGLCVVDEEECTECEVCIDVCPNDAISI